MKEAFNSVFQGVKNKIMPVINYIKVHHFS